GKNNPRLADLAELPVRLPYIHETMLIALPTGLWRNDSRIVVIPMERRGVRDKKNHDALYLRNGPRSCRVSAGTAPFHRAGGYDIVVMEEEPRRGRQIIIDEALLTNLGAGLPASTTATRSGWPSSSTSAWPCRPGCR